MNKIKNERVRKIIDFLNPRLTIKDIVLAGIIMSLWIVTNKFISINLGVTRITWSFAWSIIIGLRFFPVIGIPFVIIADSLALATTGYGWLWSYALIPPFIYLITFFMKSIIKLKSNKLWWVLSISFSLFLPLIIAIYLILENTNGHSFENLFGANGNLNSLKWHLTPMSIKIILWSFLFCFIATQIFLFTLYYFKKTKKLKYIISIQIITSVVIVIFKIIWGPFALMTFLDGSIANGIRNNKYAIYLIPRILTSPITIVVYSYIVSSINWVWELVDKKSHRWE